MKFKDFKPTLKIKNCVFLTKPQPYSCPFQSSNRPQKRRYNYKASLIRRNKTGVSNIVTSIMMLGIFLSILAMIFTIYIPIWAKSGEANHMESVVDSFLELKENVDKQIADEKSVGTTLSTRIKLGAEGGAIMGIGRTSGSLSFKNSGFNILINNTNDAKDIYGQASGMITFESRNVYYTNQEFSYENGAVIIEQDNKAVMRAKPNFDILYLDNKTTLVITLIHFSGNSSNVGGSDFHTIDTELVQSIAQSHPLIWTAEEGFPSGQNITINITTRFGNLWEEFINSELVSIPSDVRNNTPDKSGYQKKVTNYLSHIKSPFHILFDPSNYLSGPSNYPDPLDPIPHSILIIFDSYNNYNQ